MDWGDVLFIICIIISVIILTPTDYSDYDIRDKNKDNDDDNS